MGLQELVRRSRLAFIQEFEEGDYFWYISRLTALVDLVIAGLTKYRLNQSQESLVSLFNNCLKSLILHRLGETPLKDYEPSNLVRKIENHKVRIIECYDEIISDLTSPEKNHPTIFLMKKTILEP